MHRIRVAAVAVLLAGVSAAGVPAASSDGATPPRPPRPPQPPRPLAAPPLAYDGVRPVPMPHVRPQGRPVPMPHVRPQERPVPMPRVGGGPVVFRLPR